MKKCIILTAFAITLGSVFATDWSQYPAGQPVVLGAGDYLVTDADFATFNALGIVTLDDENAVLTFSLTGDEKTLTHPVIGRGKMIKDGAGVLAFGAMGNPDVPNNGKVDDSSYQDFHTTNGIDIVAGTLKFPQSQGKRGRFGHITMAANTTLYLINDGATIITSLNGDGTVINTSATAQEFRIGNAPNQSGTKSVYSGIISGGVDLRCDCHAVLLNPESSFIGNVGVYRNSSSSDFESRGILAAFSFGEKNKKSSVGSGTLVRSMFNGWFRYLGEGEETDKTFYHDFPQAAQPLLFDAGATGGLVFKGTFLVGNNNRSLRYVLTGSNTVKACTFDGPVKWNDRFAIHPFYLTKEGTGIWRLNDNANHNIYGPIAVREGTLQFTTVAETNVMSSLGSACMLYDAPANRTDLNTEEAREPYKVDYAVLIGGGTNPTLEYVGLGKSVTTTRKIALTGDVSRISFKPESVVSASMFDMVVTPQTSESELFTRSRSGSLTLAGGVSALGTGSRTLILDGAECSGTAMIAGISDGDGAVGLEKRGSGTWKVGGSYSATGPVAVKGGKVELVGATSLYRWYRFSVMKTDVGTTTWLRELGLFDENGVGYHPVMTNLYAEARKSSAYYSPGKDGVGEWLAPGECTVGYGNSATFSEHPSRVFEDNSSPFYAWTYRLAVESDTNTWMRIIFRLPDDAPAIKYYDLCQNGAAGAGGHTSVFMLEASVDGENWVELHKETNCVERTSGQWNSTGLAWAAGQNCRAEGATFGYEIPTGPAGSGSGSAPSLASANGVTVAKGATLAADGTSTLSSLTLDASAADGMGTIEGFAFSAQGTVYITNLPAGVSGKTVALTFVNCSGLENLSDWGVVANGKEKHGWTVKASDSGVSFQKPGLMILVK